MEQHATVATCYTRWLHTEPPKQKNKTQERCSAKGDIIFQQKFKENNTLRQQKSHRTQNQQSIQRDNFFKNIREVKRATSHLNTPCQYSG